MKVFGIENFCAGENYKLDQHGDFYRLSSKSGSIDFRIGDELIFVSNRMSEIVFDIVESVDIETQSITFNDWGTLHILEYCDCFARA